MLEKDLAGISLSHRSALLVTWDIFVFVFVFVLVDILRYLCLTGQLPIPLKSLCSFNEMLSDGQNINVLSETWILPFAVLFAMVAYAVLAIVFFNQDDWFHFDWVYLILKWQYQQKTRFLDNWNLMYTQCYKCCYRSMLSNFDSMLSIVDSMLSIFYSMLSAFIQCYQCLMLFLV